MTRLPMLLFQALAGFFSFIVALNDYGYVSVSNGIVPARAVVAAARQQILDEVEP
jgi:hypothetical protein